MFILKKGHYPGVYVPLRALFLVLPSPLSLDLVLSRAARDRGNSAFRGYACETAMSGM